MDTELLATLQAHCMEREPQMLELLERIVRINSFSWNKAGADEVGVILSQKLQELGLNVEHVPHDDVGDTLVARTLPLLEDPAARRVLLCGHMDTVFPPDMGFDCFEEAGGAIRGPGVLDMKSGLVAALFALDALAAVDMLAGLPLSFIINADEEVGSPHSTLIVQREASMAAFAFVFECSGLEGEVVTARKGKYGATITCRGQAGHAGQAGAAKPSAILELAHKIIAIEALNAPDRALTCNVGRAGGGITSNSVPELAVADVDCRFLSESDARFVGSSLEHIVAQVTTPGVACSLEKTGQRPPMVASESGLGLFSSLQALGEQMGIPVKQERRGGVSDANTIAALGVPVLDGLGPSGEQDHSTREYMLKDSLPQRTALAAAGILRCWEKHHP